MTTIIKSKSNGINSVSTSKRRRGGIIMLIPKIGIRVCPLYGMKYLPNSISFELVKVTCPCNLDNSITAGLNFNPKSKPLKKPRRL